MAIYFIKSKTPSATQDGSVYLNSTITSHDAYNDMVRNWKFEVSSEAKCGVDDVEILVVNKLS